MKRGILKVSLVTALAGVALGIILWSLGFTVSFSPAGTAQSLSRIYMPLVMKNYTPITPPHNISIFIVEPTPGGIVGSDLQIGVTVYSVYELQGASAQVEDRETTLEAGSSYTWTGTLSLAGLEWGRKLLTVIATDVFGESAQAQRSFIYDQKPNLSVLAPVNRTVVPANIYLHAICTDDNPAGCAWITVTVNGTVIASGKSEIDETVSFGDYDGQAVTLEFDAQDSAGQYSTHEERTVYVESSTKLIVVENVSGRIWDVQPDRILFFEESDDTYTLKILDRASKEETVVRAGTDGWRPQYGYLTPLGAIFVEWSEYSRRWQPVRYWRNGALWGWSYGNALTVAGSYAIWNDLTPTGWCCNPTLIRRDLMAGTNVTVSATGTAYTGDVAANGDVVYRGFSGQVFRYREGVNTPLTDGTYPRTDGINVIYRKSDNRIAVYGTSGEVILTSPRSAEPSPGTDYQANNGWVAFTKLDTGGVLQVWTRSPSGEERQATDFSTSSQIEALGPNGEVAFASGGRRWLTVPNYHLPPANISSTRGWSFWQEGQLFVVIDACLVQVVP